jgi:hypothetical protein
MRSDVALLTLHPAWAVVGARVTVRGLHIDVRGPRLPVVTVGGIEARVVTASTGAMACLVPEGAAPGAQPVRVDGCDGEGTLLVGTPIAKEIHQVDSPAIAADGTVYLTNSGARGQRVPVAVYAVAPGAERTDYLTEVVNATSLAFDGLGVLHISSRFDGTVMRVLGDRRVETVATDLGVACGIAFGPDGTLFVGDRSGTVFRVSPTGRVLPFATLPPSVAAYHLAMGQGGRLYVTAPTLGTRDPVYVIDRAGIVEALDVSFGRPQGLAVDDRGDLYVVDALAGNAGLYRVRDGVPPELVLAAPSLVGVPTRCIPQTAAGVFALTPRLNPSRSCGGETRRPLGRPAGRAR